MPTKEYGFDTMTLHYSEANAGSSDSVLELHEFLTMLGRIAFYRANPRSGLINVKRTEGHAALGAEAIEVVPLPGCLTALLKDHILPLGRRDNAAEFKTTTLVAPDVAQVLSAERQRLLDWWELASGGKDTLELEPFISELEKALLYTDLSIIDGSGSQHCCRFSIPQAKAAFCASCADAPKGMVPDELLEVVARCGVAKCKGVAPLGAGAAVGAFIRNLLGEADEEQVVMEATGGAPPPPPPKPPPKPPLGPRWTSSACGDATASRTSPATPRARRSTSGASPWPSASSQDEL